MGSRGHRPWELHRVLQWFAPKMCWHILVAVAAAHPHGIARDVVRAHDGDMARSQRSAGARHRRDAAEHCAVGGFFMASSQPRRTDALRAFVRCECGRGRPRTPRTRTSGEPGSYTWKVGTPLAGASVSVTRCIDRALSPERPGPSPELTLHARSALADGGATPQRAKPGTTHHHLTMHARDSARHHMPQVDLSAHRRPAGRSLATAIISTLGVARTASHGRPHRPTGSPHTCARPRRGTRARVRRSPPRSRRGRRGRERGVERGVEGVERGEECAKAPGECAWAPAGAWREGTARRGVGQRHCVCTHTLKGAGTRASGRRQAEACARGCEATSPHANC